MNGCWPLPKLAQRLFPLVLCFIGVLSGTGCSTSYPLHDAVHAGDIKRVRMLVQDKLAVNARNAYSETPLTLAVRRGNTAIVKTLVANGADVNVRTADGMSPLVIASRFRTGDLARFLVNNGANVNPPYKGTNAMSEALRFSRFDLVPLYIEKGANLDVRNQFGETPLFYAARFGNQGIIRLLIRHGADIHATAEDGRTVLHAAAMNPDKSNADLLLEIGAEVRDIDANEVGLYSTALLHEYLAVRAINQNREQQGLAHLEKASQYYSTAARKFNEVAVNHEATVAHTQTMNALLFIVTALGTQSQAQMQARQMSQATGGQVGVGYSVAAVPLQSTQRPESLAANYRALAKSCEAAGTRLTALISCVKAKSPKVQTCMTKLP